MSQSLIIKDGNAEIKSLQVDSGSNGYIANHTLVSTVTASNIKTYYTNGPDGWEWEASSGSTKIADYDKTRKSIIVSNNTYYGRCYIIMGTSSFGAITDVEAAPPHYTFALDPGGTYFADYSTAGLEHHLYVPSSSLLTDSVAMTVAVTQIY